MSSIKLTPNVSGTGIFTIASPNSNTDRTLTLPDASGTFNISGAATEVPAGSASTPSIYPTGDTNTGMFFPAADTIAFAEGGTEVVRIDTSGNLNLATSGSALQWSNASNNCYMAASSGNLQFATGTSGYVERARIDSSGNLLVGTTTVASSAKMTVSFAGGSGSSRGLVMLSGSTASTAMIAFQNPNGYAQGEILTSGTTTSYNTSSDYRLKEAVQPMTGALAKVAALKPVTYRWKVDGSDGEGFIAHELQAVVPQCVSGEKDAVDAEGKPVYQGIDTSFLVATLTAAIKEQQAIIESLTTRIAALEAA